MNGRRVVITGIEVLAPGGPGIKEFWALLSEGRTATRKITFFDPAPFRSRVAAEIDFDPEAVGHSLGASGSLEIAASALAMRHNVVPPTANLHFPDPECDLDYVPLTARDHVTNTVLTVGSGFGGFQSAMVLASPDRSVP